MLSPVSGAKVNCCSAKKLYNDDQIQEKGVQMIIDAFLKDNLDLDDEPSELEDIDEGFNPDPKVQKEFQSNSINE